MSDDSSAAVESSSTGAAAPVTESATSTPPSPEAQPTSRPDYVPEKFWNEETKGVRVKEALKAYSDLEKAFKGKLDPIKEAWSKEVAEDLKPKLAEEMKAALEAERSAKRPATPNDYVITLPDEITAKGIDVKFDENDTLMKFWREHCHENGYDQDQFNKGLAMYVQAELSKRPDAEAEKAKLGEKAQARLERIALWGKANLNDEQFSVYNNMIKDAAAVELMEAIMAKTSGPSIPDLDSISTGGETKTIADLRAMQQDPRYWNPIKRDPGFVAQVEKGFRDLYPGKTRTAY